MNPLIPTSGPKVLPWEIYRLWSCLACMNRIQGLRVKGLEEASFLLWTAKAVARLMVDGHDHLQVSRPSCWISKLILDSRIWVQKSQQDRVSVGEHWPCPHRHLHGQAWPIRMGIRLRCWASFLSKDFTFRVRMLLLRRDTFRMYDMLGTRRSKLS